ncbi:MAG: hypothetical protein UU56_C0014G0032 [Candidatus Curtissbacteria bacterium GW2011_GWA2_41_24]|uniref:Uncharacterized protein n=1 Tax=Candidatus Curtissbacteria bacterium GW2011_GWA2_41_24 TaxID=1618411 RepID=A0A0G0YTS1_9BACT|nr:MAG: hypothetical protein UU56_C0014G0032 [Candidatus Curtissbacteria bacterium GW2011_GWA2_41_24]
MSKIKTTESRKFADLALVLDRPEVQSLIIQLKQSIRKTYYPKNGKRVTVFNHKFSDKQMRQYQEWTEKIEELSNSNDLHDQKEALSLLEKVALWQDTQVTFDDLILEKLSQLKIPKTFLTPVKKAVLGLVIEDSDYQPKKFLFNFGKYNKIRRDRGLYWRYKNNKKKGYGTIAKESGLTAKTVESAINSYKQKLIMSF